MIPLKLYIKNFLSYGNQPQIIDFEPYHLVCLSGKNGHGKSALLDALTWALWGCARKVQGAAKADEGLVRLSASDMLVALDFMSNGVQYRVRRECSLERLKLVTRLDFGVIDAESGKFQSLTEKTVRETQALITKTIGIEYDAFINSAFLRQGNAHEFSRKSAKDRKELLASMLGLDAYESVRKRALELGKEEQSTKLHAIRSCEVIEASLAQEAATGAEYEAVCKELSDATERSVTCERNAEELRATQKSLEQVLLEREAIRGVHEADKADEQRLLTHIRQRVAHWRAVQAKYRTVHQSLHDQTHIQHVGSELARIQQEIAHDMTNSTRLVELQRLYHERMLELQREVSAANAAIQEVHHAHAYQVRTLEDRLGSLTQRLTVVIARRAELQKTYDLHAAQNQEGAETVSNMQAIESAIERERMRLSRMKLMIVHVMRLKDNCAVASHEPRCIACQQIIGADHLPVYTLLMERRSLRAQRMHARIQRIMSCSQERMRTYHDSLQIMRATRVRADRASEAMLRIHDEMQSCDLEMGALHDARIACERERDEASRKQLEPLRSIELIAGSDAVLQSYQLEMSTITASMAGSETRQKRCAALSIEMAAFHEHVARHAALEHEYRLQKTVRAEITQAIRQVRGLRDRMRSYESVYARCDEASERLIAVADALKRYDVERAQVQQQTQSLLLRRGALEQALRQYDRQRELAAIEREKIAACDRSMVHYAAIAHMCGKDGIPGLLIEQILPEIEQEANVLLGRLSDYQATIHLEPLRELKSGSYKETLEIKIADTLGVRPYEMFSGGEAFRIDFALRLAIAKFLARRAGAAIQTLIIDEGFGSQDEEGLSVMMESIYAVQDIFSKIIIVSHLPSMKDQFPVHFYITKGPRGSIVRVLEQG